MSGTYAEGVIPRWEFGVRDVLAACCRNPVLIDRVHPITVFVGFRGCVTQQSNVETEISLVIRQGNLICMCDTLL